MKWSTELGRVSGQIKKRPICCVNLCSGFTDSHQWRVNDSCTGARHNSPFYGSSAGEREGWCSLFFWKESNTEERSVLTIRYQYSKLTVMCLLFKDRNREGGRLINWPAMKNGVAEENGVLPEAWRAQFGPFWWLPVDCPWRNEEALGYDEWFCWSHLR